MKRLTILVLASVCMAGWVANSRAQALTPDALRKMAKRLRFFVVIEPTEKKPLRYLYADLGPHLHVYTVEDERPRLDWENTNLNARVSALFVDDLDKDGQQSIIVALKNGRILVYDVDTYNQIFENFQDEFNRITCMTPANIDDDPQDEVIFSDGEYLYIYDSVSRAQEWRSDDMYTASQILVANVDADPQPEIILNTGPVIDSRFYNLEFVKQGTAAFGRQILLLDINGDGYPEVIGESREFPLEVWDILNEEELW